MKNLKLGIPKGSLEANTIDLFKKAGWRITSDARSYFPDIDDPEISCKLVRAQEMSRYVEDGTLDLGLTGIDWIMENDSDVVVVQDLIYSKVSTQQARWVLVVRDDSPTKRSRIWREREYPRNWSTLRRNILRKETSIFMLSFPGEPPKPRLSRGWWMPLWK